MIRVRGLTKSYGGRQALRGVELGVARGECLAIMGPNGAGKTTLLRILASLTKPTQGEVEIAGLDLVRQAEDVRRQIGFLSHQPLLYGDLSAEENLRFYGRMYDVARLDERIAALLERVRLKPRRHDLVRTYSRGMRQRLAIARVLLHDPQVLLMDEPYTGLDQGAAEMLDALLLDRVDGARTVVLTTHDLAQGLRLSQHAVILAQGRITHQMDRSAWDQVGFCQEFQRHMTGGRP